MENNGKQQELSRTLREQYEELIAHDDSKLLRDLNDQYPSFRRFLLGGVYDGRRWPIGRLSMVRKGRVLTATLALDDFEIVAGYEEDSWDGLLGSIDNDLANKQCPWDRSWKAKERERAAWRTAVRGGS